MPEETQNLSEVLFRNQDRLRLHQLRLLEWLDNRNARIKGSTEKSVEEEEPARLPRKWVLTGGVNLYSWQEECIERWFQAGCRGTVKVVTGGGKTLLALAIAARLQTTQVADLRVAVVVPTIVLMHQWYDELIARGNLPAGAIGRLGGGYRDQFSRDRRILICVLATAHRDLSKTVKRARIGGKLLLVADECHRFGAKEMSQVFMTERAFNMGLSATPEREEDETANPDVGYNESLLGRELGPIIYDFTLADALKLGVIPSFTIHHFGLPLNPDEKTRYDRLSRSISDTQSELRNRAPEDAASGSGFFQWVRYLAARSKDGAGLLAGRLIHDISKRKELLYGIESRGAAVEAILKNEFAQNPDARVILFHESIEEVMNLFLRLSQCGFPVIAEHSELPGSVRETGLDLFRKGIAKIIVSARSLIEGFNVPEVDMGIIVASSSSVRQRVQSLGRVLRKHRGASGEEKTSCIQVLYARDTVDDAIYGKENWDSFTGIDRNLYYTWTPGSEAVLQPGPPRSPLPNDLKVDPEELKPACDYPGQYEGMELSCDTRGNIRNLEGAFARGAGNLVEAIMAVKGGAGRFCVTPNRRYVLVRVPAAEEWTTRYVTTLDVPLDFSSVDEMPKGDDTEVASWLSAAKPGDRYPFAAIPLLEEDLKFKGKRGGVISKRIPGGEVFARVGESAEDLEKGQDAKGLITAIKGLQASGRSVTRLEINERNHVLYREGGELFFVIALDKGLEFPD